MIDDRTRPAPTAVQHLLDRAVAEQGYPGMSAALREGERLRFGSAGAADLHSGRTWRPEDQFRIGSITKTFTATVVLQLAAERRLSLDDTVDRWLPGLVRGNGHDGTEITIRHLLAQTSGIFGYTLDQDWLDRFWSPNLLEHRFEKVAPEELVRIAMAHPAEFRPGQGWGYSNTNFVLAALIIERVTGASYAQAIEHRIARPLKLANTYAPGYRTGFHGPHIRAYSRLSVQDPQAPTHDMTELSTSWSFGAGDIVSTAGELTAFLAALLGGRLLKPAQLAEMLTMCRVPDGSWLDGYEYGLGLSSFTLPGGTTVYGHGGATIGTWSYLYGSRDGGKVMVQAVNGDWGPLFPLFTEGLDTAFSSGGRLP
ncbi:serine hydrolase domain-containing protein [Streptomyces orinoci]|uniref:Serine hydrolase domain-containing protein n=1 Tax=Streptomyces orinoci TaxID=67339 RepID=A0ABV3JVM7_STRON|nr:serine hydrolase domain-containing protein [Streptomyces orinoci]